MGLKYCISALLVLLLAYSNGEELESKSVSVITQSASFFAADVYQELRQRTADGGNVAFSPYSLSTLLVMLYAGANGQSAKEIKSALRLSGLTDSAIFESYSSISTSLNNISGVTLKTANTIYTDDKVSLRKTYVENLNKYFRGDPQSVNFSLKQSAADTINKWVANHTENKITELIKADKLTENTRAVLINAIYFKGEWEQPFDTKLTKKDKFYLSHLENEAISMDFMSLKATFGYAQIKELEAEAVSIPFQGNRASLVVLLPSNTSSFSDFEERLKGFDLSKVPEDLSYNLIQLHLPKLKLTSTLDFVADGILQKLGIKTVIGDNPNEKADLSNLAENAGNLFVSDIVQKVFVDLNEVGTTAAGVTHAVFMTKIFPSKPPMEFTVNRPFVAFIFDKLTSSILFQFRKVN